MPESRSDSIDSAKPRHEPRTLVSKLRLALDRAPVWLFAVLAVLSAYLPWFNPSGEGWVPGLALPVDWAGDWDSAIHVGLPLVFLGMIFAIAGRNEGRRMLRRGAGAGLLIVAVAHAIASFSFGDWAPGEMAASAGPYLALILGSLALWPGDVFARPYRPSPAFEDGRFRRLAITFAAVGSLVLFLGLSSSAFALYRDVFEVNGLASFGIGDFHMDVPWLFSGGGLIIVVFTVYLAIALVRHRDILWAPTRAGALILLVLAGPIPEIISNPDRDFGEIHTGYVLTFIGTLILLLAVPASQIAAGTPPWKKRTS